MVLFFVSDISDGVTPWIMVLFWMDAWEISQMWCNQGTRFLSYNVFFCKILTLEWRTVVFGYTNEINLLILLKTSVKSMNSVPISPHQIKFRMRTSNEIEEGSYVSYCKLDGGIFSLVSRTLIHRPWVIVAENRMIYLIGMGRK